MTDSLSTVETAAKLGGSRPWIYQLIKRGELEAEKIGRDWRVSKKSVERYLAKKRQKGLTDAKDTYVPGPLDQTYH